MSYETAKGLCKMTVAEADDSCEINNLPDEILINIFSFMPLETILACENVCQRWRKLARDNTLWKRFTIVYSGKPGQIEESERSLEIIKTHGQYIRLLRLQYVHNYAVISSILRQCDDLVSLELVMCRIAKQFEDEIKRWPNLRKLNLKNSLLLQRDRGILLQFDDFKYLTHLALSDFGLYSANSEALIHCRHLTHIFIEKIRELDVCFIQELIMSKQDILNTLHIYGGNAVDDRCLHLLSQCPNLEDIAIIRCENLTDKGLIALVNLKKIKHLQIWNNNNFTEANLMRTLGSPALIKLLSLSLSRIGSISPVIVDLISESYKNLKFLALYQCSEIVNTDYERQLKSKFRSIDVVLY